MENYGVYTKLTTVPAGVILDRIIRRQNKKMADVSSFTNISKKALCDLITGSIRFTSAYSSALERCLGINIQGFFCIIQTKHDTYLEHRKVSATHSPNLDILTKTTFWDVRLANIDWQKCATWAIRRVLEYGTRDEIREITRFYGIEKVTEVYKVPSNFRLYERAKLNYSRSLL